MCDIQTIAVDVSSVKDEMELINRIRKRLSIESTNIADLFTEIDKKSGKGEWDVQIALLGYKKLRRRNRDLYILIEWLSRDSLSRAIFFSKNDTIGED